MNIVVVILALIIIGVVLWLVEKYIPMDPAIKLVLRILVILIVVIWLLNVFGLLSSASLRIGR